MGRRRFLKLGLGGAAGISVLGYLERFIPAPPYASAAARRGRPHLLSDREFDTLAAFAAVVVGASANALGTRAARVAERIELEISKAQGRLAADVRAALQLVETLPVILFVGRRFTRLAPEQQARVVGRMQRSASPLLRNSYSGLRTLSMFFYYSDPRAWPRLGYAGPWAPAKFYEGGNRIENLDALADLPA